MRIALILVLGAIISLGCARVRVEAPEKPIKVDISMRLDIYQHIEKDIDAIEGIVSGSADKAKSEKGNQSWLSTILPSAYAQELSPEVEQAAYRRKDRRDQLLSLEGKGIVGENNLGLTVIRNASLADASVQGMVNSENNDRMVIYQNVAKKNSSSVEEVQKLYAKRLQADAPAGTPVETIDGWMIK